MFKKAKRTLCAGLMTAVMTAVPLSANAAELETVPSGESSVPVTFTYSCKTPHVMIPKSIEISGKSGSFNILFYCLPDEAKDLNAGISVDTPSELVLTKENTDDTVTAAVHHPKFASALTLSTFAAYKKGTVIPMSVNGSEPTDVTVWAVEATDTITAADLTPGTWNGTLTFDIAELAEE